MAFIYHRIIWLLFQISVKKLASRKQKHPSAYQFGTAHFSFQGNEIFSILTKVYILLLFHHYNVAALLVFAKKIPTLSLYKISKL